MAIIISKGGRNAQKIERTGLKAEDDLQRYVFDNPSSLPLDKQGADLLVIGREFETESGPIDVLAVDRDGDLYIIETKLYKNPDKRHVIAQMLDYGAALWKTFSDGEGFLDEVDDFLAKSAGGGLNQRLCTKYGLSDEEIDAVRTSIRRNLSDGNLRFIVLMDRLHDRLRDLISFINRKSRFSIYAVEMEFYEHEGTQIVIPKLFGAEAVKDVPSRGGGREVLESDAEFLTAVESESDRNVFRRLLALADELGGARSFRVDCLTIRLPHPERRNGQITLFALWTDGSLHIGWQKDPPSVAADYARSLAALFPGVGILSAARSDTLSRSLTAKEVFEVFDQFSAAVKRFAEHVKKAADARSAH